MFLHHYQIDFGTSLHTFEFTSQGLKGNITKVVQFTQAAEDLYFLGFGDKDDLTGTVDDLVISNNNDAEKVLATVANIVYLFTDENPDVWIYAKGNTPSRTRLYQIGISKYLEFITTYFKVLGLKSGVWKPYTRR